MHALIGIIIALAGAIGLAQVRLKNIDSQGRQIETVYRMERYKPQ